VELLAAVAILLLLMALIGPAVAEMTQAGQRRAAVIKVLNLMESARITALSTSADTYLAFADETFPDQDEAFRKMILFRRGVPHLDGTPDAANEYRIIGKWESLPDGVSFYDEEGLRSVVGDNGYTVSFTADSQFPGLPNGGELKAIRWNETGMIEEPSDPAAMQLLLYEGYYFNGQPNFTRNAERQQSPLGLFDQIQLSRFSGRAQLVVDAIPQ